MTAEKQPAPPAATPLTLHVEPSDFGPNLVAAVGLALGLSGAAMLILGFHWLSLVALPAGICGLVLTLFADRWSRSKTIFIGVIVNFVVVIAAGAACLGFQNDMRKYQAEIDKAGHDARAVQELNRILQENAPRQPSKP